MRNTTLLTLSPCLECHGATSRCEPVCARYPANECDCCIRVRLDQILEPAPRWEPLQAGVRPSVGSGCTSRGTHEEHRRGSGARRPASRGLRRNHDRDLPGWTAGERSEEALRTDEHAPVGLGHAAIAVPDDWGTNTMRCGAPMKDTVIIDVAIVPGCLAPAPTGVDSVEITQGEPLFDFTADDEFTVDGVRAQRQVTTCGADVAGRACATARCTSPRCGSPSARSPPAAPQKSDAS
jgi:hypothetical protein